MSHNTLERDQYEARQRYLRDDASRLAHAEEKGQIKTTRAMIVRIGTRRLGTPPVEVVSQLDAIASLARLEQLADHILDCETWETLIEGTSK